MMRVGRTFTYSGRRYQPGDAFDVSRLESHQVKTFVRLYGLEDMTPTPPDEEGLGSLSRAALANLARERGLVVPPRAGKDAILKLLEEEGTHV